MCMYICVYTHMYADSAVANMDSDHINERLDGFKNEEKITEGKNKRKISSEYG